MKRFLSLILAAFVVAFVAAPPVHADLKALALGAGAGAQQKDGVGGQSVQEVYDRGISWNLPIAFSALTATSGVPLSVTQVVGYTATYKGPWYVRIYNTSVVSCMALSLTYSAAYTNDLVPLGQIALASQAQANGALTIGPLSPADYMHLRGLTSTSAVKLQLGYLNR